MYQLHKLDFMWTRSFKKIQEIYTYIFLYVFMYFIYIYTQLTHRLQDYIHNTHIYNIYMHIGTYKYR